jgi:adenylosuccinate synthase
MLPELLQTTNLFELLHRIDIDLANQQQKAVSNGKVTVLCKSREFALKFHPVSVISTGCMYAIKAGTLVMHGWLMKEIRHYLQRFILRIRSKTVKD